MLDPGIICFIVFMYRSVEASTINADTELSVETEGVEVKHLPMLKMYLLS